MEEIKSNSDKSVNDESFFTSTKGDLAAYEFPEGGSSSFLKSAVGGRLLVFVLSLVFVLGVLFGVPLFLVYIGAKGVVSSGRELYASFQAQDINRIKSSLDNTKSSMKQFDSSLKLVFWMRPIPILGGYVSDAGAFVKGGLAGLEAGEEILNTAEPYADLLGLNGGKAGDGAKTAQDRIEFIVESIGTLIPKLATISERVDVAADQLNKINPNRYPEVFRGYEIRSKMIAGLDLVNQVHRFISGGRPVLEQAPYLLGIGGERRYLVIMQNDKELRPTGGFITAYSVLSVKDGKFSPGFSNDIYNLDARFNSRIPAPEAVKKYLFQDYWHLRDMNLNPDFEESMKQFMEGYKKTGSPKVDGIVAVDTELLVSLLKAIGPIGVPGFGNFSAENDSRCLCPNVVYELESYADVAGAIVWDDISGKIVYKSPRLDNRKAILGPLMNSILANAMGQSKEKLPDLFESMFSSLMQKHVLFYMEDKEVQEAMRAFNIAGKISSYNGDFLHINDANLAGAKSNLYVEQEIELKVDRGKEGTVNNLKVKYKNPQKHDGWLNGPYRDWFRIYVPKGSQLLDSSGSEVGVKTYEELGKTVFEGFFTLRPEGVLELSFQYKTLVSDKDYKLFIQKQPGTKGSLYRVGSGNSAQEFNLLQDRELKF